MVSLQTSLSNNKPASLCVQRPASVATFGDGDESSLGRETLRWWRQRRDAIICHCKTKKLRACFPKIHSYSIYIKQNKQKHGLKMVGNYHQQGSVFEAAQLPVLCYELWRWIDPLRPHVAFNNISPPPACYNIITMRGNNQINNNGVKILRVKSCKG